MSKSTHYASQHAKDRARSRLGIACDRDAWRTAFLDIVEHGRALLLSRYADGRERYLVSLAGHGVIAMYSPKDAKFITILPATYRSMEP